MRWLTTNLMSVAMVVLVIIAAAVGGAVVIWGNPGTLSFQEYLDDLKAFAYAVAGIGGARGLVAAATRIADAMKAPTIINQSVHGTTTQRRTTPKK